MNQSIIFLYRIGTLERNM